MHKEGLPRAVADLCHGPFEIHSCQQPRKSVDSDNSTIISIVSMSTKGSESFSGLDIKEKTDQLPWKRYAGLGCAVLASMCFSLSVILVKYLRNYDPMSVGVFRFGGVIVPLIFIVLYFECQQSKGPRVFESVWPLTNAEKRSQFYKLAVCGVSGGAAGLFQLYSLNYITVADSSAISYASPVCVVILAHFFLDEKCGLVSIFVALTTCFGVFVIARPPELTGAASFDMNTLIGTGIALLAMLSNATLYIVMRDLRNVHFALCSIAMTIGGTAESLTASLATRTLQAPHGIHDTLLMVVVLPASVLLGQLACTMALKLEDAGPVALVRTTDVLFSFCWQYMFLGVVPDIFSVAGAAIVISGVVVTGVRKCLAGLPQDNNLRRRLRYLLL